MIAPLRQPLRIEAAAAHQAMLLNIGDAVAQRGAALLMATFGFFCFMPYPALPFGNTSAIQIGNVLSALIALPALAFVPGARTRRSLTIYLLILVPLCLAMVKAGAAGESNFDLCIKAFVMWCVIGLTLVAAEMHAPRHALDMLTGIAVATLVHVAVGTWQYFAFQNGEFPLVDLYVNPSFLSVQDYSQTIAKWIQRPFGLFPEPSAMSASLAPFVLLWIGQMCGVIRFKHEPSPAQRALFATAACGGLGLMIISQSGHSAIALAAAILFVGIWFLRCRATARSYVAVVAVFGIALPCIVYLAAMALSNRLGGDEMGNSSWEERTASLVAGFQIMIEGSMPTFVLGMGPGLSAPTIWQSARLEAVFSVLLTYLYETGAIGLLAVMMIGRQLAMAWKKMRFDLAYAVIGGVWLIGITLTTSYEQLLPLWLTLGWLAVWPAICEPVQLRKPMAARVRPVQYRAMFNRRLLPEQQGTLGDGEGLS
jgi:hypothetical protein